MGLRLSEEQIKKVRDNLDLPETVWTLSLFLAISAGATAQLSHLASLGREKMLLTDDELKAFPHDTVKTTAEAWLLDDRQVVANAQLNKALPILLAQAEKEKQEAVKKILKAIEDEPEYPGVMPDKMWEGMSTSRDYATEAMRLSVIFTKQGIKERFEQVLRESP